MGITIDAWRTAIGTYQFSKGKSKLKHFFLPTHLFNQNNAHLFYGRREWALFLQGRTLKNKTHLCTSVIAISLFIHLLLAVCGDVHPNPGPAKPDYCDVSICHANIRSLKQRDRHGSLSTLSHISCSLAKKFSIITLSETWLSPSDLSKAYRIQGYQSPFRRDREAIHGPTGYGGVLAWVSNDLACKRRKDLEMPDIEALWLEVRSVNNKFYLCVAYRRPTKADFFDVLQANINRVMEIEGAKILITGDLNADLETYQGQKLRDFCFTNGLTIHVSEPTRVTPQSQTILDQFLSNMPQMTKSVQLLSPVSGNDHCTIGMRLLFRRRKVHPYVRTMWDFANADFDAYRNAICHTDWDECFAEDDVDAVTEKWTENVMSIAKANIPHKDVTVRPSDKPWYSNELRLLCRRKDRIHKKAKQLQTQEAWTQFRAVRNEYFNQVSEAKQEYENHKYQYLINENNSTKKWWSVVKSIQKENDAFEAIPPLEVGGHILTDDKDKASSFNEFFLEASTVDDDGHNVPDEPGVIDGGLNSIDITLKDVTDQIACLDKSKSYSPDSISPVFLKEGGEVLADSI